MIAPVGSKIDSSGLSWICYPLTLLPHRIFVLTDVGYSLTVSTRENFHMVAVDDDEFL
jgi:hypothetical protein